MTRKLLGPYRENAVIDLCAICHEGATEKCAGCGEHRCAEHFANDCAQCGMLELRRQRRITNGVGLGASLLCAPLLAAAIVGSMVGWTAVFLPPVVLLIWIALFAVPKVTQRLYRAKGLPRKRLSGKAPVKLLPAAEEKIDLECESCVVSATRCSRCGQARCAAHATEWNFYQPVVQCKDTVNCRTPAPTRQRASAATHSGRVKFIYSVVD